MTESVHTLSAGWLVSAPHLAPQGPPGRAPWGPRHARVDSEPYTACGQVAVTWHVFWELRFDPLDPAACPACVRALRAAHRENQQA